MIHAMWQESYTVNCCFAYLIWYVQCMPLPFTMFCSDLRPANLTVELRFYLHTGYTLKIWNSVNLRKWHEYLGTYCEFKPVWPLRTDLMECMVYITHLHTFGTIMVRIFITKLSVHHAVALVAIGRQVQPLGQSKMPITTNLCIGMCGKRELQSRIMHEEFHLNALNFIRLHHPYKIGMILVPCVNNLGFKMD